MNQEPRDSDVEVDEIDQDGDDLVAQVKGSRRDLRTLGHGLGALTHAVARSRRMQSLLGVALGIALTAIIVGGLAMRSAAQQANCQRLWSVETAFRSAILTDARADYDAAQKRLLVDAVTRKSRSVVEADAKAFVKAAADYDRLRAEHPVPPAPKYNC